MSLALLGTIARAADSASEQRVIVKWKAGSNRTRAQAFSTTSVRMNLLTGVELANGREIDAQRQVVGFNKTLSIVGFQAALQALRSQDDVEYAVQDERRHALLIPNDPYFSATSGRTGQWYLQNTEVAATNAMSAWDLGNVATLSTNSIVAVIDTGVRSDHPDLNGKLLPGYDFVSCDQTSCSGTNLTFLTANDGNGWDSDPSDPGDWISTDDLARPDHFFSGCGGGTNGDQPVNSSWHGTRVSGVIGANSNNGAGITGTGWNTWILPVRALGKCGGFDSDIIAAMRWAGGLTVSGVTTNSNPAHIINMSLGASGSCSAAYQDVINQLHAAGVVIVASAGNEGGSVDAPANCNGVIAVAGIRNVGTKVGYSSLGSAATIAAPAGNCVNTSGACLYSIDTTYNLGATGPGVNDYTNQTNTNLGTSFSAPIVSGTVALMLAVNSSLAPDVVKNRLQASATTFPMTASLNCHVPISDGDLQSSECNCTTSTCGAGMVNTLKAVQFATQPVVAYIAGANTIGVNKQVVLDGSGSSTTGSGPLTYSWSMSDGTPFGNSPTVTFTAPNTPGVNTINLVVTDSSTTATDVRSFSITAYATPTLSISGPTTGIAGASVNLTASAVTADNSPAASYAWSIVSGSATLSNASQSNVTVSLPNSVQTLTIQAVAVDNFGNTATATHTITVSQSLVSTSSSANTSSNSSGGGGGNFALDSLLGLSLLAFGRHRARERKPREN